MAENGEQFKSLWFRLLPRLCRYAQASAHLCTCAPAPLHTLSLSLAPLAPPVLRAACARVIYYVNLWLVKRTRVAVSISFPTMLLPNLAWLDLSCQLKGVMIGGDADLRKGKRPLTEEEKAANKAARKERADAAEAKALAARTVHVIEAELKKAKADRDWEISDEARREELNQQVQNLQKELEEKQKQTKKQTKTFTAEEIRKALDPLMPKLEDENVKTTVDALQALLKTYAERINELQRQAAAARLSPTEHGELVALREANSSIQVGVAAAKKAAPIRTEKRERKERHQRAINAVDNPKQYLNPEDREWWKTEGERVWKKLRERAKAEELRKSAGLDPSDAKPSMQEGVIDLSKITGTSNEEKVAELTQQLQALGTQAIKAMTDEIASENDALNAGGNAFDGADEDEDGV